MRFTVEETNLMCIYGTDTREGLIAELSQMQTHLQADETELKELTTSVIGKLTEMTDEEYQNTAAELIGDFE